MGLIISWCRYRGVCVTCGMTLPLRLGRSIVCKHASKGNPACMSDAGGEKKWTFPIIVFHVGISHQEQKTAARDHSQKTKTITFQDV